MLEKKGIEPAVFLEEIIKKINIEQVKAPDTYVWQRARELIYSDPRKASQILDIPYENLIGINKKKNYTLKEIGDNYFNKIEFQGVRTSSQKSELKKVQRSWNRFCKCIKVKTILEVEKIHINKYYNFIYKEYQEGKSTTWIRGFFERVKRVLNAAIKDLDHPEDIIEVLRLCRNKLKPPMQVVKYPPYRIKISEFKKILEFSNTEEKAMWLLSMNCAYYSVDVATVPISAFDWDAKTVVFRRAKPKFKGGGHRAAVLWDITIDALKKYIEDNKNRKRKTLFVSVYGMPYAEGRIREVS
jgi:integrase